MCGRYALSHTEALAERFEAEAPAARFQDRYNVAPGQLMPVVAAVDAGKRTLGVMQWGLIPRWAKDARMGYKLINARAESVFDKPIWRGVINRQRCLVPATGFYEWRAPAQAKAPKQPFYIHPHGAEIFALAGVWETWEDPAGTEVHTYSILTTGPNKEMARIHDRMPVILHQEDELLWLSPSLDNDQPTIEALLVPWEDDGLEMYAISPAVNVTTNDNKELITPLNSA